MKQLTKIAATVSLMATYCALLMLPSKVWALGIGLKMPGRDTDYTGYQQYIADIFNFAMIAGGALSVLMIIYAGFRYMTSQGNPSGINEAKDILIGSLSGFALLLLSYLILKVLGIPVT
jgi:hypothetical protein